MYDPTILWHTRETSIVGTTALSLDLAHGQTLKVQTQALLPLANITSADHAELGNRQYTGLNSR